MSSITPQSLLELLPLPAFICRGDGRLDFLTSAVLDLLGMVPGAESTERVKQEARLNFVSGQPKSIELLSSAGEALHVPLQSHEISEDLFLCLVCDADANVFTEKFHSQRLQTLGMLAGGVAHDFNNMLAGILGHITYLKTILPAQGAHVESLIAVEEGARKASGLTQQILNFSKLSPDERPARVELFGLLERTTKLLRGALPPGISVNCDGEEVEILATEAKLAQVLVNLVINARDAVGSDGKIEICVRKDCKQEEILNAFAVDELGAASYVAIEVRDDGCGMPPETISRIFEPYFSTKGSKGTGLGLATVRDIVEQLGGVIYFDSEPGSGTTVKVYLPALQEANEEVAASKPLNERGAVLQGGSERILIVDDEASVRNVLVMSLEHLGYEVIAVDCGTAAIELVKEGAISFDLVILDMLMPKLPGEVVFERLQELAPGIRVLLISGFSSEAAVQTVLENGGVGFVQKPFTIEELSSQVRECLKV